MFFQDFPGPQPLISKTFQDQSDFPRFSSDFSDPGTFKKKSKTSQYFPGGVGTLNTKKECSQMPEYAAS